MSTNVVPPNRPRRLLSIDGGGLCGIIPAQALIEIDPHYPKVSKSERRALAADRKALEAEAPKGATADPFQAGQR